MLRTLKDQSYDCEFNNKLQFIEDVLLNELYF